MQIPKYVFGSSAVRLLNFGDVHLGDHACDVEAVKRTAKMIKENDDIWWVSTGDLLNCGTKDSKSGPYGSMTIDDELEALRRIINPIQDKCLGIVESNHHARVKRSVGMNLDKLICREFDLPYLGDAGMICVVCGRASYYVAMHHGNGGGRTMGAKANAIARLEEIFPGCDLYLEGHTHTHLTWKDVLNVVDRKRNKLTPIEATFSVTGHYIDYFKSYAPSLKLKPKPIGSAIHTLAGNNNGKEVCKGIKVDFFRAG